MRPRSRSHAVLGGSFDAHAPFSLSAAPRKSTGEEPAEDAVLLGTARLGKAPGAQPGNSLDIQAAAERAGFSWLMFVLL